MLQSPSRSTTVDQPFTAISGSICSTETPPGEVITAVSIAITVTRTALWEAPETNHTCFADTPLHVGDTQTLASLRITEIVTCSNVMAVTC